MMSQGGAGQFEEAQNNIYIQGLPLHWKENDISDLCSPFGQVLEAKVLLDLEGKSKGVGFVRMFDHDSAQKVIQTISGHNPPGSATKLLLKFADSKNDSSKKRKLAQMPLIGAFAQQPAYGSGVPLNALAMGAYPPMYMYSQQQGSVAGGPASQFAVHAHASQHQPQHAYPSAQQQQPVQQQQPRASYGYPGGQSQLEHPYSASSSFGVSAEVSWEHAQQYQQQAWLAAQHPSVSASAPQPSAGNNFGGVCLFIYHLPPDTEESTLTQLFQSCGQVLSAKIVKDQASQRSKGFGFVNMANLQQAERAIKALNGYEMNGKHLLVKYKT